MARTEPLAEMRLLRKPRRWQGPEWFLVISLAVIITLGFFIIFRADLIARLDTLLQRWETVAIRLSFAGVFLAMLIGNLTVMVVMPTTLVPLLVAAAGVNPIGVGIASGLGATLGEYSGYLIGWFGAAAAERRYPNAYTVVKRIAARRPRAIQLLLFIFSLLPLPDDVLFIPLGIIRYPWWKMFLATLLGKTIAGWFIAYGGVLGGSLTQAQHLTTLGVIGQLGFLCLLVTFTYGLLKIPWDAVLRRFDRA